MTALLDTHPSLSHAASNVRLMQEILLGSTLLTPPTVPPPPPPLRAPCGGLRNDTPYWTPPVPEVPRPGFLWWHRILSSSTGPSWWGMVGSDFPDSPDGRGLPVSVFPNQHPGIGTAGNDLGARPPLGQTCPWLGSELIKPEIIIKCRNWFFCWNHFM